MNNKKNWYLNEEYKWRTLASTIAVFLTTFPMLLIFIAIILFRPSHHIHNLVEYMDALLTLRVWLASLLLAVISALTVRIHYVYAKVEVTVPVSRYSILKNIFATPRFFHAFGGSAAFVFQMFFLAQLFSNKYRSIFKLCNLGDINRPTYCLNERFFILLLFGFVLGLSHCLRYFICSENQMFFLFAQQARFRFVKYNLISSFYECGQKSLSVTKYFLAIYYFIGYTLYWVFASIIQTNTSPCRIFSIWNITDAFTTAVTVFISGTFLLLLWDTAWKLFNVYNTQNFLFLLDSVFPGDSERTMYENLGSTKPKIVQYLAMQFLTSLCQRCEASRRHIYDLNQPGEGGKALRWNKVADACLEKINNFVTRLNEYQRHCTGSLSNKFGNHDSLSSSTSSNKSSVGEAVSPVSMLRKRQPIDNDMSVFQSNTLDGSALMEASMMNSSMSAGHVPTPTLWTKQFVKSNITEIQSSGLPNTTERQNAAFKKHPGKIARLVSKIKSLKIVSYFISPIPEYELKNLYCDYRLQQWAIQSLSYLCAASVEEDRYGVVQPRLAEVISTLIELLNALERNSKATLVVSSGHNAIYFSLRSEIKIGLYRIVDAFGESINCIKFPPEYRRRIQAFSLYKE